MQKPSTMDVSVKENAYVSQEYENEMQIDAINRLMDEIQVQYDPTDQIRLADIERKQQHDKANDKVNLAV